MILHLISSCSDSHDPQKVNCQIQMFAENNGDVSRNNVAKKNMWQESTLSLL